MKCVLDVGNRATTPRTVWRRTIGNAKPASAVSTMKEIALRCAMNAGLWDIFQAYILNQAGMSLKSERPMRSMSEARAQYGLLWSHNER